MQSLEEIEDKRLKIYISYLSWNFCFDDTYLRMES